MEQRTDDLAQPPLDDAKGSQALARAYLALATAQRDRGEFDRAEITLKFARQLHPDDLKLAVEWAQLAMVREDWVGAAGRWQSVVADFPEAPAKVYAWLAIANREQGKLGVAAAVLDWARSRYPGEVKLAVEWAQLALVQKDWAEARRRFEAVIEMFDTKAPPVVYARLASALRAQEEVEQAEHVISTARSRFPHDAKIAYEWAQQAAVADNPGEAVIRWRAVIDDFADEMPARMFLRAASHLRDQGLLDEARRVVSHAQQRFEGNDQLVRLTAELPMVEGDWAGALKGWESVLDLHRQRSKAHFSLPLRSATHDWHEAAWSDLAMSWATGAVEFSPSEGLCCAIAEVLRRLEAFEHMRSFLSSSLVAHGASVRLKFLKLVAVLSEFSTRPSDGAEGLAHAAEEVAAVFGDEGAAVLLQESARIHEALAQLATQPAADQGFSAVNLVRVPEGSAAELAVRAGRYLTPHTVQGLVRELSEAESWPELSEGGAPLRARARRTADECGARYAELPYLPAELLSDAAFFLLYAEMCVHEPMRRLAQWFARQEDDRPVFVDLPKTKLTYLNGYAENTLGVTEFGQLYLYSELRRCGVNAFLCRVEASVAGPSSLTFAPSPALMQARAVEREPGTPAAGVAIVPAGIRSVLQVIGQLQEPLVISAGYLLKEFAYDRTFRRGLRIRLAASVHPPRSLLPQVRLDLGRVVAVPTLQIAGWASAAEVVVERSETIARDWLGWFDHVMHEYFVDLSRRCTAEAQLRDVREAHICDHLFAESEVFAAAVRARGGKTVLWPHSTNPAHVDVRRANFDVVHAVTRAGGDLWRKAFPDVDVVHSASHVLPNPTSDLRTDPAHPLSVVIFGGKSTLGSMPFVHQSWHEDSYRRFLSGLERLQNDHAIDVYYKPKGFFGENERWLAGIVGRSAGWRTVVEHPLRLDLPNMLFVSISLATSALFEGLSRGIPCAVVKDFRSQEYATIVPGAVPMGPSDEILDVVRSCLAADGLQALATRQMAYYREESGLDQVSAGLTAGPPVRRRLGRSSWRS